ncbi:alpha/beta hydrolase [Pseudonocardia xishanensis]|uniref:Alpha/beta fold hydrolase n=1 Tax=Pseudonocardia xishanensis TaxID=630995 RepID=A0ABP8RUW7_9PSEU
MRPSELKQVVAGGWTTSYLEAGDPSAPDVVLLHDGAYGTTAELCWGAVAESLAHSYHVLAPDMLGWGGSDKVAFFDRSPYVSRLAQVTAFCRELDIQSAAFVGVSFGGSVLLRALVESPCPLPVSLAVALNATGGPFRLPGPLQALGDYSEPSEPAAARITALLVDDLGRLDDHIAARYRGSLIPGHWEAMAAASLRNPALPAASPPADFLAQLSAVKVPVVYIEGTKDQLLEPGWSDKMRAATPGSRALAAPFPHEPNIDMPADLTALLLDLLREHAS